MAYTPEVDKTFVIIIQLIAKDKVLKIRIDRKVLDVSSVPFLAKRRQRKHGKVCMFGELGVGVSKW